MSNNVKEARLVITRDDGEEEVVPMQVMKGTHGPAVLSTNAIFAKTGLFLHDPGFLSTSSCESGITFIDGDKGQLLYRGYSVDNLVADADITCVDVQYLLLYGDLPSKTERAEYWYKVTHHSMVHEHLRNFFNGFRVDSHPMAIMTGVMGAMSSFYPNAQNVNDPVERDLACLRLIAKMPTIAAMAHKYSIGQPFVYPRNDLDYASNFLHMMFSVPTETYVIHPTVAKAMDTILLLHADHEQNASTSTVRIAGSSKANAFACIAAGIASLWGPAHGGANEAVLNMLDEIGTVDGVPAFLESVKRKEKLAYGFGHRVYRNYDPRARAMEKVTRDVLDALNIQDPLLDVAVALEKACRQDEYFTSRKLYPNIDFWTGICLRAIGVPRAMFTVLFAVGRSVGWVAQWREMWEQDTRQRISRPRQLYTGAAERPIKPRL